MHQVLPKTLKVWSQVFHRVQWWEREGVDYIAFERAKKRNNILYSNFHSWGGG